MTDRSQNTVTKEDVLQVASSLKMYPTDEQIQTVIDRYPEGCEQDPTGTWNLIVEQLLYETLE